MSDLPPPVIKPLFSRAEAAVPPPFAAAEAAAATPLSAALTTAFRFLYVVVAVLAAVWLTSGIRSIESGSQAVIYRLGAVDRTVGPGLAIAWPRPFEEVVPVPGPDRQLSLTVDRLDLAGRDSGAIAPGAGLDPRKDGGYALTGDAGVVHLKGALTWQVSDAKAYVVARERVEAAISRAFLAATIAACAGRSLDGVMVASPDVASQAQNESMALSREHLRLDIAGGINQRLAGIGLGVTVHRVDLTAFLPDQARPAFDAVIAAEGSAAKEIAEARTFAVTAAQDSEAKATGIRAAARGRAAQVIAKARIDTNRLRELLAEQDPERRSLALNRIYREKLATIIQRAGSVVTVPPGEPARVWVPGR